MKTQTPDELLDFHLEPENVVNKVVLQTELLKDILSELDTTSDMIEVEHNLMLDILHYSIICIIISYFDNITATFITFSTFFSNQYSWFGWNLSY